MLNRIVYAMNVLKALYTITSNEYMDEWKQPKDPSEVVVTVMDWDWDAEEETAPATTAPSGFLGFNVDDLYSFVVDAIEGSQSFAVTALEAAKSFGPYVLPLLSLFVGTLYVLGFRPFERLDRLSGVWRGAMAFIILVASFLAVWTVPTVVIQACVVVLLARVVVGLSRAAWDWMWWTLHRLVDVLGGSAFLVLLVDQRHNDWKALSGMLMLWALVRWALYSARSYVPMSWLCATERACTSLTFPLFVCLRLVWWAVRNVWALVWLAIVAICGAAVAGAIGAAKGVQTICGSFKGMVQLSTVRVCDLVSAVVAPAVPIAASQEATMPLPVPVPAAPAVEMKAMPEVEVSTANATVVSDEVPVDMSTANTAVVSDEVVPVEASTAKSKVPKSLVQPKPRRRTCPAAKSKAECAPQRRSKRIADRGGR
jgi:hypothetical protein